MALAWCFWMVCIFSQTYASARAWLLLLVWPFSWHCKPQWKKKTFCCLSHSWWVGGGPPSVGVIHLTVVRVNELVSLFGSISVHYSLIQSVLEWLQVFLPPFLACFVRLSCSSSLLFPSSLFPDENAIRGMHQRGISLQFIRRRQREQGKK